MEHKHIFIPTQASLPCSKDEGKPDCESWAVHPLALKRKVAASPARHLCGCSGRFGDSERLKDPTSPFCVHFCPYHLPLHAHLSFLMAPSQMVSHTEMSALPKLFSPHCSEFNFLSIMYIWLSFYGMCTLQRTLLDGLTGPYGVKSLSIPP